MLGENVLYPCLPKTRRARLIISSAAPTYQPMIQRDNASTAKMSSFGVRRLDGALVSFVPIRVVSWIVIVPSKIANRAAIHKA